MADSEFVQSEGERETEGKREGEKSETRYSPANKRMSMYVVDPVNRMTARSMPCRVHMFRKQPGYGVRSKREEGRGEAGQGVRRVRGKG